MGQQFGLAQGSSWDLGWIPSCVHTRVRTAYLRLLAGEGGAPWFSSVSPHLSPDKSVSWQLSRILREQTPGAKAQNWQSSLLPRSVAQTSPMASPESRSREQTLSLDERTDSHIAEDVDTGRGRALGPFVDSAEGTLWGSPGPGGQCGRAGLLTGRGP